MDVKMGEVENYIMDVTDEILRELNEILWEMPENLIIYTPNIIKSILASLTGTMVIRFFEDEKTNEEIDEILQDISDGIRQAFSLGLFKRGTITRTSDIKKEIN